MKGTTTTTKNHVSAQEALQRLQEGNYRFAKNLTSLTTLNHEERRQRLVAQQTPFAIVLCCSDSRAPAEIVFDQGLGDLFVIRVAGNIVAPSLIGSIEFAASTFGTELVVVMGHSNCGAVSAALKVEQFGQGVASENIRAIVDRITPSIHPLVSMVRENHIELSPEELLHQCVQANVMASVNQIKSSSKIIEKLIGDKKLKVVGAEYSLESGIVHFINDEPTPKHSENTLEVKASSVAYPQ